MTEGCNARGRAGALQRLGHIVQLMEGSGRENRFDRLMYGFWRRTGYGAAHRVNRSILAIASRFKPDILWVDKGTNIARVALDRLREEYPRLKFVYYTPDDARIRGNLPKPLKKALPLFDIVVTTKQNNVEYLKKLGARRVFRSWKGFDPDAHNPPVESERDNSVEDRAVFIGSFEKERAETLRMLVRNGIPVTIISNWPEWAELGRENGPIEWRNTEVYGSEYACLIGSAGVSLCFLRKLADDQHTQRSVEIPACGGVMVAERTSEHAQLFQEGTEAEYFESDEECVMKTRALLADRERRERIRVAARRRCVLDEYTWAGRMQEIVKAVQGHEARKTG